MVRNSWQKGQPKERRKTQTVGFPATASEEMLVFVGGGARGAAGGWRQFMSFILSYRSVVGLAKGPRSFVAPDRYSGVPKGRRRRKRR